MAADYAIAFTLVTADGEHIAADAKHNSDLFFALRGGGGSTWGVVTSVTVKTVPDIKMPVLNIAFNEPDPEKFWKGFNAFYQDAINYMDNELYIFSIMSQGVFNTAPILGPGKTLAQLQALFAPLVSRLDTIGVNYTIATAEYPSLVEMHKAQFPFLDIAGTGMITGSRIMPRESVAANLTKILDAYRRGAEAGLVFLGYMLHSGGPGGHMTDNAINPAWRDAILVPLYNGNLLGNETEAQLDAVINLVNTQTTKFAEFTPGGGSYLNEVRNIL